MAEPVLRRSGARGVLQLTLVNYFVMGAGLITGPLLGRALGDSGRGQVAQVDTVLQFAGQLFGLGLMGCFAQAIATRRETPGRLLGAARRIMLRAIPFSFLLLPLVLVEPMRDLPTAPKLVAAAGILLLPGWAWNLGSLGIITGTGDLRAFAMVRAVPITLNLVAVVVLFVGGWLTPASALTSMVLTTVVAAYVAGRLTRAVAEPGAPVGPLVRFGVRSMGGQLTQMANVRLDQLLIQPWLSYAALGHYAVAVSAAGMPVAVNQAMYARTMSVAGGEDGTWDPHASERLIRHSIAMAVVGAAGMAVVAPVLIPGLYGSDFEASVRPLLLLLPGTVGLALNGPLAMLMTFLGRPGLASIYELVSLGVTVIGLIAFVPSHGIAAAAAVSSVAYLTAAALGLRFLRHHGVRRIVPRPADLVDIARGLRRALRRA